MEKPNIPPRPTQATASSLSSSAAATSSSSSDNTNNKVRRAPPPRRKSPPPPNNAAAVGPKFPTPSSGGSHENLSTSSSDRPVVHIPTRDIQPQTNTTPSTASEKSGMKGLLNNLVTSVQGWYLTEGFTIIRF